MSFLFRHNVSVECQENRGNISVKIQEYLVLISINTNVLIEKKVRVEWGFSQQISKTSNKRVM